MSEIVFNPPKPQVSEADLQSQIENFQTTLASLNQQVISLQEVLQERDEQIADLKMRLSDCATVSQDMPGGLAVVGVPRVDDTLTIVGVLINIYKLIFQPGKAAA